MNRLDDGKLLPDGPFAYRAAVSQRAAGLVINNAINTPRECYDNLKAILHNCVRRGPESQNLHGIPNFRAHLAGRIIHITMFNPSRGKKLQNDFDKIDWDAA